MRQPILFLAKSSYSCLTQVFFPPGYNLVEAVNAQVRRAASAHAMTGVARVANKTGGNISQLENSENLFCLLDIAAQIAFAVNDQSRGCDVVKVAHR